MRVIIQNDDFGVNYSFNKGVVLSLKSGLTTSVSVRTNGVAFSEAVKLLKNSYKNKGIGLHLNLTEGPTHLNSLANSNGKYKYTYIEYILLSLSKNKKVLNSIEQELNYQLQICKEIGLKIDHLSGNDHIHMIPQIFEICCRLAIKYNIKYIRLTREPFYLTNSPIQNLKPLANTNILKFILLNLFAKINLKTLKKYRLNTTQAFYGVLYTNNMTQTAVINALKNAQNKNFEAIEILLHPALPDKRDLIYTSSFIEKYTNQNNRSVELKTLESKKLKSYIQKLKILLSTYKDIKN